jgi:hypothetical protein
MSGERPAWRVWLPAFGVALFVVAHLVVLRHTASHFALPAVAVPAVIALAVAKHVGIFAALRWRWKVRRGRPTTASSPSPPLPRAGAR